MRLYVAGPLFSEAERAWLDALAGRLRAEGFECFVPHESFPELTDVSVDAVYRIDAEGLRSANALVAWLDGPIVDDGTACEIGMFAELVRSGGTASYVLHVIDDQSGVGTDGTAGDFTGDGKVDVLVANKKGTFVFRQTP